MRKEKAMSSLPPRATWGRGGTTHTGTGSGFKGKDSLNPSEINNTKETVIRNGRSLMPVCSSLS